MVYSYCDVFEGRDDWGGLRSGDCQKCWHNEAAELRVIPACECIDYARDVWKSTKYPERDFDSKEEAEEAEKPAKSVKIPEDWLF